MSYNQTIDVKTMPDFLTIDSIILLIFCLSIPCILISILIHTIFCKEAKDECDISLSMEEIGELIEDPDTPSEEVEECCGPIYHKI